MKNNFLKPGFTIVEVLTVLFIVSLGLVGILSLIVQNIQSQSYNKSNLIAYQLAQEGVELIRQVRDSNWREGLSYNDKLAAGQYYMDYADTAPHAHSPGSPAELLLKQDSASFYVHNPALPMATLFSRLITLQTIDDHSFQVNATISWQERNRNYTYDLETILYDWY
jgi:type II secretory pathway pseudopilin PulG